MKKASYYLLFAVFAALLFITGSAYAQLSGHFRIGDTIPDLPLRHVLNHPNESASLSDFRSQLLILDFWDVGCAPCIKNMPKMQALQEAFPDDIRILLVTKSTEKQVMDLREHNANVRDCTLPMAIADSILTSRFSYQTVPTYAWIDEDGVLCHFTSASDFLTPGYLRRFLEGDRLQMPLKQEYGDFKSMESLLTEGGGRNLDKLNYYSLISRRVHFDGAPGTPLYDRFTGDRVGLHLVNHTRTNLFLMAYRKELSTNGFRIRDTRLIVNLPDSVDYETLEKHFLDDDWKDRNLFCYESRMPSGRLDRTYDVMQRDLAVYFDVNARVEYREMHCLVLQPIDPEVELQKLHSKGGDMRISMPIYSDSLSLTNSPFYNVLMGIDMFFSIIGGDVPILINECAIDQLTPIDLHIRTADKSLEALRPQLRPYGLDLIPERRSIPMLVLGQ